MYCFIQRCHSHCTQNHQLRRLFQPPGQRLPCRLRLDSQSPRRVLRKSLSGLNYSSHMLTILLRSSRTSALTTPVATLRRRALSTLTVIPTTFTSPPATTSHPSTVNRPSTSTGPSAATSAPAVLSICRPTSTPGLRLACALETTTTRSWLPRATRAAVPLTSMFRPSKMEALRDRGGKGNWLELLMASYGYYLASPTNR